MAKRPVATVPAPDKRCETLPGLTSTAPAAPEPLPVPAAPEPLPVPAEPEPEPLPVPAEPEPLQVTAEPEPLPVPAEPEPLQVTAEPEPLQVPGRKTIDWKQTPYAVILGARVLQAVATEAEVLKFIETLTKKKQQKVVVGQVRNLSFTIKFNP